ncbi:MAG: cytochrome c [Pseudomonadota bacterium]
MTRTAFLLLTLAACNGGVPTEDDISAERGAALFATNCAACHGADARGDSAPGLTGLSAANGGTFPRNAVMAQIDGLGQHGRTMPEFGAADLGDTVIVEHDGLGTPVPADLLALATYLEQVQE